MPKRVFIVEDDEDIQTFLQIALTAPEFAYEVECIQNGEAALERLKSGDYPDILLLDLMMPRLNGYALLEQLYQLELHHSFAIVVMSADVLTRQQLERLGIKAFLSKPFSVSDLQSALEGLY